MFANSPDAATTSRSADVLPVQGTQGRVFKQILPPPRPRECFAERSVRLWLGGRDDLIALRCDDALVPAAALEPHGTRTISAFVGLHSAMPQPEFLSVRRDL
jgi:hypothetical protein